jgi:hypothetical protein
MVAEEAQAEEEGGKAVSVLQLAQEQADRIMADAQAQAQETIREAQDIRAAMLLEAEHEATKAKEEAGQEAKRIRSAATADAREQVAIAAREGMRAAAALPAAVMSEAEVHRANAGIIRDYLKQNVTLGQNLLKAMDKAATEAAARTRTALSGVSEPGEGTPEQ